MTDSTCQVCDGNGYAYDTALGEITGYCPECNGTGKKEVTASWSQYHIEATVLVSSHVTFPDSITHKIQYEVLVHEGDVANNSDYLMELIIKSLDSVDGIHTQSISVGKLLDPVRMYNISEPNQQTLF